jgi:hypothetical protein
MNRPLIIFTIASLVIVCGCSRTFTIVKEDSPINRQNISILNHSCKASESLVYLKNGEVLRVEDLDLANDSISFVLRVPESIRFLSCNDVKKIVTRDGAGSFIKALGFGTASGTLGLIAGAAASPMGSGHGTGIPTSWIIGPAIGFLFGFTAGEIIGTDKVFNFEE